MVLDHSLRSLPITTRPIDGETPDSYLRRLAAANWLPVETVWSRMRLAHGGLPTRRSPHLARDELEVLGGLQPGWFANNAAHHRLWRRCPHMNWEFGRCAVCCRSPQEQSGCLRCGRSEPTRVATLDGPICRRHARWHHADSDIELTGQPRYLAAGRHLRNALARRGVAVGTGELELASSLLVSFAGNEAPVRLGRQALLDAGGLDLDSPEGALLLMFPEAVRLVDMLVDPAFTSYLLSPRWSAARQAELLEAAVCGVLGQEPLGSAPVLVEEALAHSNTAVSAAYGMVGIRRRSRQCVMQRALTAAAGTHRACLLRHLDAWRMPIFRPPRAGRAAPRVGVMMRGY